MLFSQLSSSRHFGERTRPQSASRGKRKSHGIGAPELMLTMSVVCVRGIYRTWATNAWRLGTYRRMQDKMLRWKNTSIARAFDTWLVNQYQLRMLRVIAQRFSHHGMQHGFEHCFRVWKQAARQLKVARRRGARLLVGRVYRSLLTGTWRCWRRLGAALARERQVLSQVRYFDPCA